MIWNSLHQEIIHVVHNIHTSLTNTFHALSKNNKLVPQMSLTWQVIIMIYTNIFDHNRMNLRACNWIDEHLYWTFNDSQCSRNHSLNLKCSLTSRVESSCVSFVFQYHGWYDTIFLNKKITHSHYKIITFSSIGI